MLEDALAKSPGFPWPHLGLAEVYGTQVLLNNQQRLKHLQAFLTARPDALEGYSYLTDSDDKAALAFDSARLRIWLSAAHGLSGHRRSCHAVPARPARLGI